MLTNILGMSMVSARWVLRMLSDDLSRFEDDPSDFIEQVVTQDQTLVHHFDPESKMQSKKWKHPGSSPPKKFKRVHSTGKVIASVFWDSQGVIMTDYLQQGHTINGAYFAGRFRWLRQEIARKRQGKLICCVLPICHKLPRLLQLNVDMKSFFTPILSLYGSF